MTQLTRRQLEVCELVAEGLSNKEIAVRLVVQPATVKATLSTAMERLGTSSRVLVARWVWQGHRWES